METNHLSPFSLYQTSLRYKTSFRLELSPTYHKKNYQRQLALSRDNVNGELCKHTYLTNKEKLLEYHFDQTYMWCKDFSWKTNFRPGKVTQIFLLSNILCLINKESSRSKGCSWTTWLWNDWEFLDKICDFIKVFMPSTWRVQCAARKSESLSISLFEFMQQKKKLNSSLK